MPLQTESEFGEYSGDGEAGSHGSRAKCTTSGADTAAAKSVGEHRLPGIAKYNVTSESELPKSSDKAGSTWTKTSNTAIADVTAVEKSVGEIRPLGFMKYSATAESELAECSSCSSHDQCRRYGSRTYC